MSKNILKLCTILAIFIMLFSFSFCHAEDIATTTVEPAQSENTSDTTPEVHKGDLYLFGTTIVMDKLVDGNVFICGTDVTVTGQVNGNLFVAANTLKFDKNPNDSDYSCYVRNSIFACASSIYYNAACNDLYVATNNLEMTYDSYVIRDVKAVASDVVLKAAIGRDLDLACGKINFGEEKENSAVVYGNIRYTSPTEATIPEGVVEDVAKQVTYTPEIIEEKTNSIYDIVISFLTFVITIIAIYALSNLLAPKFIEKIHAIHLSPLQLVIDFVIGLLSVFIALIVFFILLFTAIGWKLALIFALVFILALFVAVPYFVVVITDSLKNVCKANNTPKYYLLLALVSIVLLGISYIPFVGGIISGFISMIALGMFLRLFFPYKALSEEEKEQIENAKQRAKELKEQSKKEKSEDK